MIPISTQIEKVALLISTPELPLSLATRKLFATAFVMSPRREFTIQQLKDWYGSHGTFINRCVSRLERAGLFECDIGPEKRHGGVTPMFSISKSFMNQFN